MNGKNITHLAAVFLVLLIFCLGAAVPSFAVSPSNSGLAGLWEYPTAEMPGDGCGFIHYEDFYPYRSGGVSLGLFPWLEFNLRVNEFENGRKISDNYGRYKDKAADVKLLLSGQRGLLPSVAVGALDLAGTEIRKAYFAAGTWRSGQFGLTLGYASDVYNGFYGGLTWQPLDWLEFKAEYSPLDYEADKEGNISLHPGPADEKYNLGIVLKSPWGLDGSVSWQRGEEFCFGLSYNFDLSKPLAGSRKKIEKKDPTSADWADADIGAMVSSLQRELGKKGSGLRNVVVLAGDRKVHVAFENIGYATQAEGVARAAVLAAQTLPWDTDVFSCAVMLRGAAVARIELNRSQLALIRLGKLTVSDLPRDFAAWAPKTKYGVLPGETWQYAAGPGDTIHTGELEIRAALAYEPRIDRTLQDFYQDRFDIDYTGRVRSSSGWEAYLKVRQPLGNNVDIWWEPEMSDKTRVWKGVLSYLHKFDKNLWGLGEAGYLDYHYFGANVWGRWYLKDSPFWLGGRVTEFKERAYDSFAGLADSNYRVDENLTAIYQYKPYGDNDWTTAWWLEGGYHDPNYNADLMVRYGKFADGDKGYRVDARRGWNGVVVGMYYTDTDVSQVRKDAARFDKSYTDVGMYLHIPLSFWYAGRPSSTYFDQEFTLLSTFMVDAGRVPGAWMSPESLMGELRPDALSLECGRALEELTAQLNGAEELPDHSGDVYGLREYLTGQWRRDQALRDY